MCFNSSQIFIRRSNETMEELIRNMNDAITETEHAIQAFVDRMRLLSQQKDADVATAQQALSDATNRVRGMIPMIPATF